MGVGDKLGDEWYEVSTNVGGKQEGRDKVGFGVCFT